MANAETITNALPVATDDSAIAPLSREAAMWRIAVAEYEQALAKQNAVEAEVNACSDALQNEVPDRNDDFAPYGLTRLHDTTDRKKLILYAQTAITIRDCKGKGDNYPNAEEYSEIAREATDAVDRYLAWAKAHSEASERIYGDVEKHFDEACDKRGEAQNKLLLTPAPDADAMLYKLDLLTAYMRECDGQDTPSVEAIRDDAKRLFGKAA